MIWPANLPNLNLIKNVWAILKDKKSIVVNLVLLHAMQWGRMGGPSTRRIPARARQYAAPLSDGN